MWGGVCERERKRERERRKGAYVKPNPITLNKILLVFRFLYVFFTWKRWSNFFFFFFGHGPLLNSLSICCSIVSVLCFGFFWP